MKNNENLSPLVILSKMLRNESMRIEAANKKLSWEFLKLSKDVLAEGEKLGDVMATRIKEMLVKLKLSGL